MRAAIRLRRGTIGTCGRDAGGRIGLLRPRDRGFHSLWCLGVTASSASVGEAGKTILGTKRLAERKAGRRPDEISNRRRYCAGYRGAFLEETFLFCLLNFWQVCRIVCYDLTVVPGRSFDGALGSRANSSLGSARPTCYLQRLTQNLHLLPTGRGPIGGSPPWRNASFWAAPDGTAGRGAALRGRLFDDCPVDWNCPCAGVNRRAHVDSRDVARWAGRGAVRRD